MSAILTPHWTPIRERAGIGPHGVRRDYVKDNVRFKIVPAGRRSTKTLHAKRKLIRALPSHLKIPIQDRPSWWNESWRYFAGAPTQDQAVDIFWEDLVKLTPPEWIQRIYKGKKPVIKTIFNSEIHIVGMDEARRIEGQPWNGGVLDEFPDMKPDVWGSNIVPILTDRNAWLIILGVPDYKKPNNKTFKELFDKGLDPKFPDYKSYTWFSSDVLSEEAIELMRGSMSPIQFREEAEASWENAPGRAYQEFNRVLHVKECEFNPYEPVLVSCDFNRHHHNWGLYQFGKLSNGQDGYRAFDEVYMADGTVEWMLTKLDEKFAEHDVSGEVWFFGDQSGNSPNAFATDSGWQQIKAHVKGRQPRVQFRYLPQGAIADRVDTVNAQLKNASGLVRTEVSPKCLNLIRDFEEVTMDLLYSNRKTAELSHASDNFGYLVCQHSGTLRSKDISKRIKQHYGR